MKILKSPHITLISLFFLLIYNNTGECSRDISYDSRIISDLTTLNTNPVGGEKEADWVLIKITPSDASGEIFEGILTDAKTGKLTEQGQVSALYSGIIKTLYSFQQAKPLNANYTYKWKQPARLIDQGVWVQSGYRSPYLPFDSLGLAISQVNSEKTDVSKFDPLYLIPATWESFVPEYFKTQQDNLDVFKFNGEKNTAEGAAKLRSFSKNTNPLISISAVQRILQQRKIDPSLISDLKAIQNLALDSTGFKQAALLSLILQWSTEEEKKGLIGLIQQMIKGANSSEKLLWLAFGALATRESEVSKLRFQNRQALQAAEDILTLISLKRKIMGVDTDTDKYVDVVVRASGVIHSPPQK